MYNEGFLGWRAGGNAGTIWIIVEGGGKAFSGPVMEACSLLPRVRLSSIPCGEFL
jgi:hypothetical protein